MLSRNSSRGCRYLSTLSVVSQTMTAFGLTASVSLMMAWILPKSMNDSTTAGLSRLPTGSARDRPLDAAARSLHGPHFNEIQRTEAWIVNDASFTSPAKCMWFISSSAKIDAVCELSSKDADTAAPAGRARSMLARAPSVARSTPLVPEPRTRTGTQRAPASSFGWLGDQNLVSLSRLLTWTGTPRMPSSSPQWAGISDTCIW